MAFGTVSSGAILYQASMIFPAPSIRKDERIMPKTVFPYMDFLPHTP